MEVQEAVLLAVSDKQPYAWRAAWLLWSVIEESDPRVQSHVQNIIDSLGSKNDDHQRELLKILLMMELSNEQEGFLFDFCISIWEQIQKKPSVRFTAFNMILRLAKKHPELANEIEFLIQDQYLESLSQAAKKSIAKKTKNLLK